MTGIKLGVTCLGNIELHWIAMLWSLVGMEECHDADHFTSPEGIPGIPKTNFNNRPNSFKVLSPARTCVVYYKDEESLEESIDVNVVDNDEKDIANVVVDSDEKFEAPALVEDNDVGPILLKGLEAEAIGEDDISDQTTETIIG